MCRYVCVVCALYVGRACALCESRLRFMLIAFALRHVYVIPGLRMCFIYLPMRCTLYVDCVCALRGLCIRFTCIKNDLTPVKCVDFEALPMEFSIAIISVHKSAPMDRKSQTQLEFYIEKDLVIKWLLILMFIRLRFRFL